MLRSMNDLEDYTIRATDGTIGLVKDFYFDDESWVIRYLVIDTGNWLSSRKVLISPIAIDQPNWAEKELSVSITKEQVKGSPDIDTEQPVSRQYEMQYLGYYRYPYYWNGVGFWGNGAYPGMMMTGAFTTIAPVASREGEVAYARAEEARHRDDDIHLRSCKAVVDYHIHATDGDIGHIQEMLVDEETWAVRYLVVNTSNWWIGHKVLIAPQWISEVSWSNEKVYINLTRQAIKDAPPYDSTAQLNREQEAAIHAHYDTPGYWTSEASETKQAMRQ
jgi:uncharacterized protein YrrD